MSLKKRFVKNAFKRSAFGVVAVACIATANLMAETPSPKQPEIASVDAVDPAKRVGPGERTKSTNFKITVKFLDVKSGDKISVLAGRSGNIQKLPPRLLTDPEVAAKSATLELAFSNDGPGAQRLIVVLDRPSSTPGAPDQTSASKPFDLLIDTIGPVVREIKLLGVPGGPSVLNVTFEDDDVDPGLAKTAANYVINGTGGTGAFTTAAGVQPAGITMSADNRTAQIVVGALRTDSYQLSIKEALKDGLANTAPPQQTFIFSSLPEAERGTHVQFPEYTARPPQRKAEVFNPGDRVETRVARLYYYRDAHRVAQIINRNVKSHNRAAVTQAQQNAEEARTIANQKVADRKQREAAAIRAAEATRMAEHELAAAREALEEIRAVNAQSTQGAAAAARASTAASRQAAPEVAALTRRISELTAKITKLDASIAADGTSLASHEKQVSGFDEDITGLDAQIESQKVDLANADLDVTKLDLEIVKSQMILSQLAKDQANASPQTEKDRIGAAFTAQENKHKDLVAQKTAAEGSKTAAQDAIKSLSAMYSAKLKERAVPEAKRKFLADRLNRLSADREAASDEQEELKAKKDSLTNASTDLTADETQLKQRSGVAKTATTEFVAKVREAETKVASLREIERNKQEDIDKAQEAEDRAKENQFRAEVAAATADPDTYVAGEVGSLDPVTQVSVSVIGEGLIQLRGPIRGINKIRTMINQIDSPVGQVKVGIFTVQINGEHGDRMENVASRVEGNIDLSRYLTNQSMGLLRRSIQEIAGVMVNSVNGEMQGHRQVDRDRKYLYAFFGRDFIDELYEMDSEFLRTENKLLSLHSMDTTNPSQAFFIMALAKNDVRQMILERFQYLVQCEMPNIEWDFRRSAHITVNGKICKDKVMPLKDVAQNVHDKYHFRNLHGFFTAWVDGTNTMTPMQREFIRLAQVFKSQMVAEVELKQRVIERGLIEDQANTELDFAEKSQGVRDKAQGAVIASLDGLVDSQTQLTQLIAEMDATLAVLDEQMSRIKNTTARDNVTRRAILTKLRTQPPGGNRQLTDSESAQVDIARKNYLSLLNTIKSKRDFFPEPFWDELQAESIPKSPTTLIEAQNQLQDMATKTEDSDVYEDSWLFRGNEYLSRWSDIGRAFRTLVDILANPDSKAIDIDRAYNSAMRISEERFPRSEGIPPKLVNLIKQTTQVRTSLQYSEYGIVRSRKIEHRLRKDIDHRKLLEFLTDEQEEKHIELVEGTRSHIAQIDSYLKRLAIALEDDFKVQFYDPAFAEVRKASREWDVNLGQVERTTILTNNRAFAKVSPQATMEFDLPKRDIMITEAMKGAKAVVNEYGTLLQDPTFLSVAGMMSGSPAVGGVPGTSAVPGLPGQGRPAAGVRNVLPGQSTDATEQLMAETGGPNRKFGSEFEKLIPDPAIYKIETGTGFEIRPVIQPDGHSIIYDFDYMYTTNVREPVRPDEKHLGRVKRHYIHTEVQTASFELREISRYQVALKVSRTSRGVPLMEDIPGVGTLFRPLPSDESSLQQNIILGQSTVYPTLFDLMGLRWSKHVVDVDHIGLRDLEHVIRGRNTTIHDFTFDEASKRVDGFLDIETKQKDHVRPDLYHQQRFPSPYHPGGYQNPQLKDERDPLGRGFDRTDTRPEEFRDPQYDSKYRVPVDQLPTRGSRPEVIELGPLPSAPLSKVPGASPAEEIQLQGHTRVSDGRLPSSSSKKAVQSDAPTNTQADPTKTSAAPTSGKPKMFNLPSFGSRKKK